MKTYPNVAQDNSHSIGHTPLVRVQRVLDGAEANVLAKIEGRNPAYSVKCRIGAAMEIGRASCRERVWSDV